MWVSPPAALSRLVAEKSKAHVLVLCIWSRSKKEGVLQRVGGAPEDAVFRVDLAP